MKSDMCIVYKVTFTFLNMFVQKCYFLPRDIVARIKLDPKLMITNLMMTCFVCGTNFFYLSSKVCSTHLEMGTKMKLVDFIIAHNINHNYLLSF